MIKFGLALLISGFASIVVADVVVPTRTIRANTVIMASDVTLKTLQTQDGFLHIRDVVGLETRTTLYAGRPILFDDVGPPALVARNEVVSIEFTSGSLIIKTEGRSLQRGGVGDVIRIMNLNSRATLFGEVQPNGTVKVRK